MAGLVPAIHVFRQIAQVVDARDKRGHDSGVFRHCEERKRRSNPELIKRDWIASLPLAMTRFRHSRTPVAALDVLPPALDPCDTRA
jgi:hypothetical protein